MELLLMITERRSPARRSAGQGCWGDLKCYSGVLVSVIYSAPVRSAVCSKSLAENISVVSSIVFCAVVVDVVVVVPVDVLTDIPDSCVPVVAVVVDVWLPHPASVNAANVVIKNIFDFPELFLFI